MDTMSITSSFVRGHLMTVSLGRYPSAETLTAWLPTGACVAFKVKLPSPPLSAVAMNASSFACATGVPESVATTCPGTFQGGGGGGGVGGVGAWGDLLP